MILNAQKLLSHLELATVFLPVENKTIKILLEEKNQIYQTNLSETLP